MYVINVSAVSSGGIGPANTAKGRTGAEGKKVSIKKSSKDDAEISDRLVIGRLSVGAFLQYFLMSAPNLPYLVHSQIRHYTFEKGKKLVRNLLLNIAS